MERDDYSFFGYYLCSVNEWRVPLGREVENRRRGTCAKFKRNKRYNIDVVVVSLQYVKRSLQSGRLSVSFRNQFGPYVFKCI